MKKHRFLIFGSKTYGSQPTLEKEGCEFTFVPFPHSRISYGRLSDYDFVITDYSVFKDGPSDEKEIFEKQMNEALGKGIVIVLLHYDEDVVEHDFNYDFEINKLGKYQIGIPILNYFDMRGKKYNEVMPRFEIKRNEFKNFLEKWGATKNYFYKINTDVPISLDVIACHEFRLFGFSIDVICGSVIFLPCQRNYGD